MEVRVDLTPLGTYHSFSAFEMIRITLTLKKINASRTTLISYVFFFYRLSTHYSSSAIILTMLLAAFSLLTALVCLSGYLITCDELSYETTRQIHGRTTLGILILQVYS